MAADIGVWTMASITVLVLLLLSLLDFQYLDTQHVHLNSPGPWPQDLLDHDSQFVKVKHSFGPDPWPDGNHPTGNALCALYAFIV